MLLTRQTIPETLTLKQEGKHSLRYPAQPGPYFHLAGMAAAAQTYTHVQAYAFAFFFDMRQQKVELRSEVGGHT